jgi:hypothetical protein
VIDRNLTALSAAAGAADTMLFLAAQPELFRTAPGRAAGSVAVLALWTSVAARAAMEGPDSSAPTVAIAGALLGVNAALLAVHLRHHVAGPRVFAGVALSTLALVDAVRRR